MGRKKINIGPVQESQSNPPAEEQKVRAGRMSREAEKFIIEHKNTFTADEIAKKLNLSLRSVNEVLDVYGNLPEKNTAWKQYLRRSIAWKQLKEEFSGEELDYFEEKFIALMEQFKEDVLTTEETQVFQLIKLEILMSRNLRQKQKIREHIEKFDKLQKSIVDKYGGDFTKLEEKDHNFIIELEKQLAGSRSAEQTTSKEYIELQKQHGDILNELKGTRNQRVKEIENSKVSFVGLVKSLMDRDKQEKEGRQLELFKLATQKEMDRLGSPFQYADKMIDLPILTSETIEKLDQQQESEESKELQEQQ